MEKIVQKFSIVYISRGEKTEVFHSTEEIPEDLKKRIARSARGSQVETLLIANDKGRELLRSEGWSKQKKEEGDGGARLSPRARWAILGLLASGVGALLAWVVRLH
ncbi:MAG: hypothetical protein IANPNBLG_02240 [Bryobacteraceae bacterium]|nr:hypothetical protein [Bryobacteraceae bacterium]